MAALRATTFGLRRPTSILRTVIRLRRRLMVALRHAFAAWLPGLFLAMLAAEKLEGPRWLVLLPAGPVVTIYLTILAIQASFGLRTGSRDGQAQGADRVRFRDTGLTAFGRVVGRVHIACFTFLQLAPILAIPTFGLLVPLAYVLRAPDWAWYAASLTLLVAPVGLSLTTLYLDATGHFERCRGAARSACKLRR